MNDQGWNGDGTEQPERVRPDFGCALVMGSGLPLHIEILPPKDPNGPRRLATPEDLRTLAAHFWLWAQGSETTRQSMGRFEDLNREKRRGLWRPGR